MSEKISGTITRVSPARDDKPMGIFLKEQWFNPTDKTKEFVEILKSGTEVEIEVDKNKITFIKVLKEAPKTAPIPNHGSKDDYWKEKAELDKILQKKISRHGAINSAIELQKVKLQNDIKIEGPLFEDTKRIADMILNYVNEGA